MFKPRTKEYHLVAGYDNGTIALTTKERDAIVLFVNGADRNSALTHIPSRRHQQIIELALVVGMAVRVIQITNPILAGAKILTPVK